MFKIGMAIYFVPKKVAKVIEFLVCCQWQIKKKKKNKTHWNIQMRSVKVAAYFILCASYPNH